MTERVVDSKRIEAPTCNDVLLQAEALNVLAKAVMITTISTRKVFSNIPVVASTMDTLTKACKVNAIACQDDTGILFTLLTAKKQAKPAWQVMRSEHATITPSITRNPNHLLVKSDAVVVQSQISDALLVDAYRELAGAVTRRDVQLKATMDQKVSVAMTENNMTTTAPGTSSKEANRIFAKYKIEKIPPLNNNELLNGFIAIKAFDYAVKQLNVTGEASRLLVSAALELVSGYKGLCQKRVAARVEVKVTAGERGLTSTVINPVKVRWYELDVVARGVAKYAGPETMIVAKAGVLRYPATYDVSRTVIMSGIPVTADRGIRYSGDVVIAVAVGASPVLVESLLTSNDESPGDVKVSRVRTLKSYCGTGLLSALRNASPDQYFQQHGTEQAPKSVEGPVPHRGPLAVMLFQLYGKLRSDIGYVGAALLVVLVNFLRDARDEVPDGLLRDVINTCEAPIYMGCS